MSYENNISNLSRLLSEQYNFAQSTITSREINTSEPLVFWILDIRIRVSSIGVQFNVRPGDLIRVSVFNYGPYDLIAVLATLRVTCTNPFLVQKYI